MDRLYHYAVHKGSWLYFWPACLSPGEFTEEEVNGPNRTRWITINRGDVNCPNCLRMMGS